MTFRKVFLKLDVFRIRYESVPFILACKYNKAPEYSYFLGFEKEVIIVGSEQI